MTITYPHEQTLTLRSECRGYLFSYTVAVAFISFLFSLSLIVISIIYLFIHRRYDRGEILAVLNSKNFCSPQKCSARSTSLATEVSVHRLENGVLGGNIKHSVVLECSVSYVGLTYC